MFGKFRVFSQGDTRNEKPRAPVEAKPPATAATEKKAEIDQAADAQGKESREHETPARQSLPQTHHANATANTARSSDYILTSPRSVGERTNALGFTPKDPDEDSVSSALEEFAHVNHAYAGTELLNRFIAQRALIRKKAAENAQKAVKVDAAVVKVFEVCSQHHNSLFKFCEELQTLPKIKDSLGVILSQIESIITETNALEEIILEEMGEKHHRDLADWRHDIEDEKQEYYNRQMKHVKHVTDELMHKRERIQRENDRQILMEQRRIHQEQAAHNTHVDATEAQKKKKVGYVPFVLPSNFVLPNETVNSDADVPEESLPTLLPTKNTSHDSEKLPRHEERRTEGKADATAEIEAPNMPASTLKEQESSSEHEDDDDETDEEDPDDTDDGAVDEGSDSEDDENDETGDEESHGEEEADEESEK